MPRYINPYTDFGFKRLFGTEPNKAILIAFLNALFEQATEPGLEKHVITDLNYLPGEHLGILETDRRAVFDVYCETESGKKIIVEMQNSYQQFYKDRSIYYASIPIHEQGLKGDWNYKLNAVYVVSIMNFSFGVDSLQTEDGTDKTSVSELKQYYHTRVMLMDTRQKTVFSDKLTLLFLETKKFNKTENELTTQLDKWMYLLKNISDMMEQPKTIFEPIFVQFMEQAEIARFTPQERRGYDVSMMAYRDVKNSVDTARNDGLKDGMEKGVKMGKAEALVNLMKNFKLSIEQALKGLSIPEAEWDDYRALVAQLEAHPVT
ncbi:MAG: PD-(D/E)XK nuclease family transposase [Proteobacteria bacterium]|nr:PD-(D/E)XK nuclease family transposase [Pseudomonadota bacterium]